jgi:hypothetical protein
MEMAYSMSDGLRKSSIWKSEVAKNAEVEFVDLIDVFQY